MPRLLKVLDAPLLAPPGYVLDDAAFSKGKAVGVDVLDGLDGAVLVVVPAHLYVQCRGGYRCRGAITRGAVVGAVILVVEAATFNSGVDDGVHWITFFCLKS